MTTFALTAEQLSDNFVSSVKTLYTEISPLARWVFGTSARALWLRVYNTSDSWSLLHVAIRANGAHHATCNSYQAGWNEFTVDLPATHNRIEIVMSGVINMVPDKWGAYPTLVKFLGCVDTVNVVESSAGGVVLLGDSIACGAYADVENKNGWVALLRNAATVPVALHGYGGWDLYDNGDDGTKRQAVADLITGKSPSRIYLAIGTNDYGFQPWTAGAFGAAYGDLLDRLHAGAPTAKIVAQTPIVRANEDTPNSRGSTLQDYRDAIAAAQASRAAWCQLVDGRGLVRLANLVDGVHPTTLGHAEYFTAARGVVGV